MEEVFIVLDIHHKGSISRKGSKNHSVSDANADDGHKDQPFVQVVGEEEEVDLDCIPHKTYDEFVIPVNQLIDDEDEDEELQAARAKVKEFHRKKKAGRKDKKMEEVVGAEPPINEVDELEQAEDDEVGGSSNESDRNSS
ncbi:conserved hypothetical protein [Ricinus communis]|uniref:Uncharacterized protein n=1 Tax=Ricinus communis TaxID=3988 RepID=B9SHN8_RICCO|nr:conserved hypothetical protein [Ricinus communis]